MSLRCRPLLINSVRTPWARRGNRRASCWAVAHGDERRATRISEGHDGRPAGGYERATKEARAASGVPNKPMVPTASHSPTTNPLHPMRRQIGQPLGALRD
jgi:hypothetical protein